MDERQETQEAILTAKLICEAAELCGEKDSVKKDRVTIYKPKEETVGKAKDLMRAVDSKDEEEIKRATSIFLRKLKF